MDDTCLCGEGAETFLHLTGVQVDQQEGSETRSSRERHEDTGGGSHEGSAAWKTGVWDTRVRDLCS